MFGSLKTLAILCLALGLAAGTEKKWWETASFYQIYPRSFKDSDGDGVGDLKGVTEELAYLKEIGITATWLSPIFTSPMADFGYDIANFTEVDPLFGTMEDFENMMTQAKSLGIKILLDLVPNHSSDECDWFQRSVNGDPEYEDFYVWHPGKIVDGVRQPPSNWISEFRGSMWTWREERQAYYLHQFIAKQPDFNYRNPNVREMMKGVMRFWLDKGIDGFRVDATHHLYEVAPDAEGNLPDEPRNFAVSDPESYDYLEHIYTLDQPENVDLIYEFRQVLDEYKAMFGGDDRILMTEAYSPIEVLMRYYGNGTAEGSQIPFNFLMIKTMTNASNAHDYAEVINEWMSNMPEGRTANWVMGNHDNNRIGSRLGVERMDLINMMMLTLPGCSITYNGEEIGMTDVWISWNDTVDPWGCNSNPEIYDTLSRDPERTPFQWDDTKNAGFSSGDSTWLPVADNYKLVNVKRERGIPLSHLNVYKQLHALRTEKTFSDGAVDILAASENVLAIKRFLDGEYTFVILLNLMSDVETVNLNAIFVELTPELEYVAITDKSIRRIGDKTYTDTVVLMPYEAIVLKTTSKIN